MRRASSIAYVDGHRNLLVGDGTGRTHLLDDQAIASCQVAGVT